MAAELLVDEPAPDLLRITGEIDTHTAPTLADLLSAVGGGTDLGLDLSDTTFISSAGLSVLLSTADRLAEAGGSLRIVRASETVARLVELSGLAGRLPIGDEVGDDD